MKNFKQKYGSWALVTGASSGIGAQISEQLAQQPCYKHLITLPNNCIFHFAFLM